MSTEKKEILMKKIMEDLARNDVSRFINENKNKKLIDSLAD